MKIKYTKFKFSLVAIILLILIIGIAAATKITLPLPEDFATQDYSQNLIKQVEGKILEVDNKLDEIRELELPIPSESNILDRIGQYKKQFELANNFFESQDYFNASSYAKQSKAEAEIISFALNRILSGEITDYEEVPQLGTKEYLLDIGETVNLGRVNWMKLTLLNISDSNTADIELQIKEKSNKISLRRDESYNMEGELFIYFEGAVSFPGEEDKKGEFSVTIQDDKNVKREIIKAPLEGTKDALETIGGASGLDCKEYLAECESGNKILCIKWGTNCRDKEEVTVGIKDEVKFKDEKVYINDKELKIMPDTASEKAIATLQFKKIIEIELKDTGKPTYEIIGKKEVKIFGLFKKEMPIKTEINAETGDIEKTKKPWWTFFAKE